MVPQIHEGASISPAKSGTADQEKYSVSRSISSGTSDGIGGYYEDLHIDFLVCSTHNMCCVYG